MLQLIVLIIFVLSLGGIVFILVRKIPVLSQLPEVHEGVQKENIFNNWINKIKNISPDKIILLKFLSKTRVLVLKLEKVVDNWLQKMRKKFIAEKKQAESRSETVASTTGENGNPPASRPPKDTTLPPVPPTVPPM